MLQPILQLTPVQSVHFEKRGNVYFADFGEAVFGNLQIVLLGEVPTTTISVRLGEKLNEDGSIDRAPVGTANFVTETLTTQYGQRLYQPEFTSEEGLESGNMSIRNAPDIGNVTLFRFAEIEIAEGAFTLGSSSVRQTFVHAASDSTANSFQSDSGTWGADGESCDRRSA